VPISPQAALDLEPVDIGQLHVEHDQCGPERVDGLERGEASVGDFRDEAVESDGHRDEVGEVGLVVDDEDTRPVGATRGFRHLLILHREPQGFLREGSPEQLDGR
jgi:hypothetical protein